MLNPHVLFFFIAAVSLEATAAMPSAAELGDPLWVRVNGVALEVRSAVVGMPTENLADAILDAWRDAGHAGLRFSPSPDRTVLGRQKGSVHETLTLLPNDDPKSTTVIHAANDSRQTTSTIPAPPFKLPRGFRVIQTIEQMSRSIPIFTFRLESDVRPTETIERLRTALIEAQWLLTTRMSGIEESALLTARRGKQELIATANARSGSTAVIVEITGRAP